MDKSDLGVDDLGIDYASVWFNIQSNLALADSMLPPLPILEAGQ